MKLLAITAAAMTVALTSVRPQDTAEVTAALQVFRVSQSHGASASAVAYNPTANEYLIVWRNSAPGNPRILGQRIDAATGREVGANDFPISSAGPDPFVPAVAYNVATNSYFVAWLEYATDKPIAGREVAADGTLSPEYRLAATSEGCGNCPGSAPSLAYNETSGEYLLVYRYYANSGSNELRLVRLGPGGVVLGSTTAAPAGNQATTQWAEPSVVWNALDNEYLVAWVHPYPEAVLGLRLDPGAVPIGSAFAIGKGWPTYNNQRRPRIAHNTVRNEYLVVWNIYGGTGSHVYGQLLTSAGAPIGVDDLRINDAPGAGVADVAFDRRRNEYLVAWVFSPWYAGAPRVLGQRLSAAAVAIGTNEFPLSPGGRWSGWPAVVYAAEHAEYLVTFAHQSADLSTGYYDIFATRYSPPTRLVVGLGRSGGGELQPWDTTSSPFALTSLQLPWPTYNDVNGELHPASGDVDGDGLDEIVVGLGSGSDGWIAIFDDADHGRALLKWVQLPWGSYNASNGTIWPAVGDIDGDGLDEIVAGLGSGGQGFYAIFDDAAHGYAFLTWRRVNWSSYNTTQSGETRPAVANIDGGSFSEIVIGLGPGGAGWLELVDDAEAGHAHLRWLRVGWTDYINGPGETYPAAGDVDGDGYDEIVVGLGANSDGWVQVFDDAFAGLVHKGWLQVNWSDHANVNGETHPAVGDIDGDAAHEIVLGLGVYPGQGGWFEIRDDFATSFAPLGWRNVGRTDFYYAGGATFPAVGRAP